MTKQDRDELESIALERVHNCKEAVDMYWKGNRLLIELVLRDIEYWDNYPQHRDIIYPSIWN